jgi:hypothetical protein
LPNQPEAVLDSCIDDMLAGRDWSASLPQEEKLRAEVLGLMEVALKVVHLAAITASIEPAQKRRVWRKVERDTSIRQSRIRSIALYRLPLLPPLWIRPEAC